MTIQRVTTWRTALKNTPILKRVPYTVQIFVHVIIYMLSNSLNQSIARETNKCRRYHSVTSTFKRLLLFVKNDFIYAVLHTFEDLKTFTD